MKATAELKMLPVRTQAGRIQSPEKAEAGG